MPQKRGGNPLPPAPPAQKSRISTDLKSEVESIDRMSDQTRLEDEVRRLDAALAAQKAEQAARDVEMRAMYESMVTASHRDKAAAESVVQQLSFETAGKQAAEQALVANEAREERLQHEVQAALQQSAAKVATAASSEERIARAAQHAGEVARSATSETQRLREEL